MVERREARYKDRLSSCSKATWQKLSSLDTVDCRKHRVREGQPNVCNQSPRLLGTVHTFTLDASMKVPFSVGF